MQKKGVAIDSEEEEEVEAATSASCASQLDEDSAGHSLASVRGNFPRLSINGATYLAVFTIFLLPKFVQDGRKNTVIFQQDEDSRHYVLYVRTFLNAEFLADGFGMVEYPCDGQQFAYLAYMQLGQKHRIGILFSGKCDTQPEQMLRKAVFTLHDGKGVNRGAVDVMLFPEKMINTRCLEDIGGRRKFSATQTWRGSSMKYVERILQQALYCQLQDASCRANEWFITAIYSAHLGSLLHITLLLNSRKRCERRDATPVAYSCPSPTAIHEDFTVSTSDILSGTYLANRLHTAVLRVCSACDDDPATVTDEHSQRYNGNTGRLGRRGDESLGVRVSVALFLTVTNACCYFVMFERTSLSDLNCRRNDNFLVRVAKKASRILKPEVIADTEIFPLQTTIPLYNALHSLNTRHFTAATKYCNDKHILLVPQNLRLSFLYWHKNFVASKSYFCHHKLLSSGAQAGWRLVSAASVTATSPHFGLAAFFFMYCNKANHIDCNFLEKQMFHIVYWYAMFIEHFLRPTIAQQTPAFFPSIFFSVFSELTFSSVREAECRVAVIPAAASNRSPLQRPITLITWPTPMRLKRSENGAAPECKCGGNRRSLRKPTDQRRLPARFPLGENPGATPPGIEPDSPKTSIGTAEEEVHSQSNSDWNTRRQVGGELAKVVAQCSQYDKQTENLPCRRHRGANPRPSDYRSATLPLSYEG
ncbi:hypothetical protein PR048_028425 [Dryococelus australis]|uniref:Uncharacterized protein n=1 Tax=Dryococelus australis TaxID=614101 RepID=A0ABQ9GAI7_9NEOP|nr:hypothetical protein PR048_028425 [Dryococelus australis]